MISVEYKKLVTITALLSVLIVNAVTIGTDSHIALSRHYDKTNVFENSHINVQTDTGQRQGREATGGTSPISDSCTASSSDTITQGAVPSPSSSCPTIHPTVLTLNLFPPSVPRGGVVSLSGTLTDICTTAGVNGATIIFTFTGSFFMTYKKALWISFCITELSNKFGVEVVISMAN